MAALIAGTIDLAIQLYKYHGSFACVNWWEVGGQTLLGALEGPLSELGELGAAAEGSTLEIGVSESWGNAGTLGRHFADHGADFGATSAEDYANQASQFLQRSQGEGLPTKIDANGVIRVYDPANNTFGSFNPNGTTRTFFKPTSPSYFQRQPGTLVP